MALASNATVDLVDRPRPQIRYQDGGTLRIKVYLDSTLDLATLATVTVKRPGGQDCTTPVNAAACSIDGTSKIISYALTAGNSDLLPAYGDAYAPWTALWAVTCSDGTVRKFLTVFDVVKNPFYGSVSQSDLVNHHADLTDSLFSGETTAQVYIDMAQEDIQRKFENGGYRFWLILDTESVRRQIEHLALAKFFAARVTGAPDDRWKELRDYHQKEADAWWENTRYLYDVNQTGDVTPDEVGRAAGQMFFRV